MPDDLVIERLETLLVARLNTSATPPTAAALAQGLHRYGPASMHTAQWREAVTGCLRGLEGNGIVDAGHRVLRADELKRRTGAHGVKRWQQWSDRILPGLALRVRSDDVKSHKQLATRDAWSAAIVARVYGMWTKGQPPTATRICDALTWRALGFTTAPKLCPAEIRAHFLRSYIEVDIGSPERMLRQLAAKLIGAPRPDLKAFHVALIRGWLTGCELGRRSVPQPARGTPEPLAAVPAMVPSLIDAVRSAARAARDGVFGDRKVFISSVWSALRSIPPWSELALDDFTAGRVSAHRNRELELARADLVGAMDPALVATSETRTEGATFHFIVREPVQ